jgi:aspartokinase-like uncharacterized kinase
MLNFCCKSHAPFQLPRALLPPRLFIEAHAIRHSHRQYNDEIRAWIAVQQKTNQSTEIRKPCA